MKSNREIKIEVKNLFEKKINNDLLNKNRDMNNFTITNNFSKMYFDNINKNLMKNMNHQNNMNISFTQTQKTRNIKKKLTSNYIEQNGNKKLNISDINKVIHTKKNINNNEYKLSDIDCTTFNNRNGRKNKMIISFTERSSSSKKIDFPKMKLEYQDGMNKILDLEDNDNNSNVNYNTCYDENNVFKNIQKIPISRKSINNLIISTNYERNNNTISASKKIRINKSKGEFRLNKIKINKKEENQKMTVDNLKEQINQNIINNYDAKDKKENRKSDTNIEKYFNNEKNNDIQNNNDNSLDFVIINNNDNIDNIEEKEDINKYDFIIPDKYSYNDSKLLNTLDTDGKIIKIYSNNKKEINFKSGVKKEIFEDGHQLVHFPNGDMKQHFPDGKIVYYFNETKTVQTTYPDGLNIFKFNNNQVEKHYPDGSKFIIFPNGTKRRISKEEIEDNYISDDDEQINQINNKKFNTVEFNNNI
jgi:centromere protein J